MSYCKGGLDGWMGGRGEEEKRKSGWVGGWVGVPCGEEEGGFFAVCFGSLEEGVEEVEDSFS